MRKVVSGDAGADLLLAEAQARLEAARAGESIHPIDESVPRRRLAGVGRATVELARLTRRLLGATSHARGICVE
jgi:hypothetical protein